MNACPFCGSKNVIRAEEERRIDVPMFRPFFYQAAILACNECGESSELSDENEAALVKVEKTAKRESAEDLIARLSKEHSMAYFERALGLPARTVARWKTGDLSAAALALLRVVTVYPFVLDVADMGFTPSAARKALILAALDRLNDAVQRECTEESSPASISRR